jgi:hypothetical protein
LDFFHVLSTFYTEFILIVFYLFNIVTFSKGEIEFSYFDDQIPETNEYPNRHGFFKTQKIELQYLGKSYNKLK